MKLVKKLHKLYCLHKVKFIHQSAHTSFSKQSDYSSNEFKIWYGNYMADKLSQEASALKIQDNESLSDTSDDYSYESDLGDGWEDQRAHNLPREKRQESLKMGTNIVVYTLSGEKS